jgi:hypothetical protein
VPINVRHVLKEGHPSNKELGQVDTSAGRVRHREAEKARRVAIRGLQDDISAYFLVPGNEMISVGRLLLFGKFTTGSGSGSTVHLPYFSVVIYLRIGQRAFPGLVQSLIDTS